MKNWLWIPLLLVAALCVARCSDDVGQVADDAGRPTPTPANAMMASMPPFTGEADADFMRQMKVHHRSAIAMAEAELRQGDDRQARALAGRIIRGQRAEIAEIDAWLAARK